PTEAAVLVGTTKYLLAAVRGDREMENGVLLPFLLFTTQFFIPGVRWAPGAHVDLVFGFAALMVFSAVLWAPLCVLLARRYAFSGVRCLGWSAMGFSFGWVGLVLLLTLLESPARILCPKCGKLRVVIRDHCEHCSAVHAVPGPDGTEIFE